MGREVSDTLHFNLKEKRVRVRKFLSENLNVYLSGKKGTPKQVMSRFQYLIIYPLKVSAGIMMAALLHVGAIMGWQKS
jgi:hypothetical protein